LFFPEKAFLKDHSNIARMAMKTGIRRKSGLIPLKMVSSHAVRADISPVFPSEGSTAEPDETGSWVKQAMYFTIVGITYNRSFL
jgi:hypothetical protein